MVNKDTGKGMDKGMDKDTTVRVTCSCGQRIFERSCRNCRDRTDWRALDHALYAAIHQAIHEAHPPPEHHLSVDLATTTTTQDD